MLTIGAAIYISEKKIFKSNKPFGNTKMFLMRSKRVERLMWSTYLLCKDDTSFDINNAAII